MLQIFGIVSAVLSIIMVIPYIRDIFLLKTKPQRASWFIWTVLGVIAFFSQWAKGATDSLWLTAGQTLAVFVVVLLSIKYGTGGFTRKDLVALAAAGLGLILWYITDEALFAFGLVLMIDSIGSLLTAIKIYQDPKSETLSTWIMSSASGIFGALAVGSLSPILLAYPMYIFLANFTIAGAKLLGEKRGN